MGRSEAPGSVSTLPAPPPGWLFLEPDAVPERWRNRAITMAMVPLMPEEAAQILERGRATLALEPLDEPLARLVARGASTELIAARLALSARTVQRRISELRRRLGARSKGELARLLAARGYAS